MLRVGQTLVTLQDAPLAPRERGDVAPRSRG